MPTRSFLTTTAAATLAFLSFPSIAQAAPRGSIDCPLKSISSEDRARLGASMVKEGDAAAAMTSAHKFISEAARPCDKANKWTAGQSEDAITWAEYGLMAEELERQGGMNAADAVVVRAYIDEDAKRVENLQRFTALQQSQLLDELRKRGAQLRSSAGDIDRQIPVIMLIIEMRKLETDFASS